MRIRQDDYRPFLLTLYSLCCYAADSGNRYSPEDAYIPGGRPAEGNPYRDGTEEHALWAAGHEEAAGEAEANESEGS